MLEKSLLPYLAIGVSLGGVIGSLIADIIGGVLILQVFSLFAYFSAYRIYKPDTNVLADSFPTQKNILYWIRYYYRNNI